MRRAVICIIILCCGLFVDVRAQSRLYPKSNTNYNSSSMKYHQRVDSLLLKGGDYSRFAFEIRPSFSGESGCWFDDKDSVLVLRTANQNIWYYVSSYTVDRRRKSLKDLAVTEYRCPVSKEAVQALNKLFLSAILSSSYLASPFGFDGTSYQLFVRGGRFSAECWSPQDKDSNCGKLVDILQHLCKAIQSNDSQEIDGLIPAAEALTGQFEDLYPADVKETDIWLMWGE